MEEERFQVRHYSQDLATFGVVFDEDELMKNITIPFLLRSFPLYLDRHWNLLHTFHTFAWTDSVASWCILSPIASGHSHETDLTEKPLHG